MTLNMGLGDVFRELYDIAVDIIEMFGDMWDWMIEPIELPGWVESVFDFLSLEVNIVPLHLIGAGTILTLLALIIIKNVVPTA